MKNKKYKFWVLMVVLVGIYLFITPIHTTAKPQVPVDDKDNSLPINTTLSQQYKHRANKDDVVTVQYVNFTYHPYGKKIYHNNTGDYHYDGKPFYSCDIKITRKGQEVYFAYKDNHDITNKYCRSERIETTPFPRGLGFSLNGDSIIKVTYSTTSDWVHPWGKDGDTNIDQNLTPFKGLYCVYEDIKGTGNTFTVNVTKDGIPSYIQNGNYPLPDFEIDNTDFSWGALTECPKYAMLSSYTQNLLYSHGFFADEKKGGLFHVMKLNTVIDEASPVEHLDNKLNEIVMNFNKNTVDKLKNCFGSYYIEKWMQDDAFTCDKMDSNITIQCFNTDQLTAINNEIQKALKELDSLKVGSKTLEEWSKIDSVSEHMMELVKLYRNARNEVGVTGTAVKNILDCYYERHKDSFSGAEQDKINSSFNTTTDILEKNEEKVEHLDKTFHWSFTTTIPKEVNCSDYLTPEMQKILRMIYYFIVIAGSVAVAVMGMLDFVGAMASSDQDSIMKAVKKFAFRLLAVIIILLLPKLLKLIISGILGIGDPFCGIF